MLRSNYVGEPLGCRKTESSFKPSQELTVFERLSRLSIGDLERIAKKDPGYGSVAVEVLIKKYKTINEVRPTIKNTLIRLSNYSSEASRLRISQGLPNIRALASVALKEFEVAESQRRLNGIKIEGYKTVVEYRKTNSSKKELEMPKKKNTGKGSNKGRGR